jgi:hypothetical protein
MQLALCLHMNSQEYLYEKTSHEYAPPDGGPRATCPALAAGNPAANSSAHLDFPRLGPAGARRTRRLETE